ITYSEFSTEAYQILPEEQFVPLSELIEGSSFDPKAAKWEYYEKSARVFALYLRPILTTVNFDYYLPDSPIMDLINLLKKHYSSGKTPAELKLSDTLMAAIPKSMLHYLKSNPSDDSIDPRRFEFFVYAKMYHHFY